MAYDMDDMPRKAGALNPIVQGKALDIANLPEYEGRDEDEVMAEARTEAEKWFETASEEEKEDIRRRYPDDKDIKD